MELKREIKPRENEIKPMATELNMDMPFVDVQGSVEFLDSIMQARDELFDVQLKNGLTAHKKLAGLLMK
ncbi:hypothetical protein HOC35_01935 [Candidatus Woesearchaeota archaeon]|nr:hypothetical protein [Candidatus Woesearchaeota archaeon]